MRSCLVRACAALGALQAAGAAGAQPPMVVAGEVRDEHGLPAPGALVHLVWRCHPELPARIAYWLGRDLFDEATAAADARGRFRVTTERPGPFGLWAERDARWLSGLQFPVSPGDFRTIVLETPQAAAVHVKTSTGRASAPVAAAEVVARVLPDDLAWAPDLPYPVLLQRATTDAAGNCRFALPAGRALRFSTLIGGDEVIHWPADWRHSTTELATVAHAAQTRGRIVDHVTGAPVAGAVVHDLWAPALRTTTDQNGEFALPIRPTGFLHVVPTAHRRGVLGPQTHAARRSAVPETFAVPAGQALTARFVDHQGAPLAGARVVFAGPGSNLRADRAEALVVWEDRLGPDGVLRARWLEPHMPLAAFVELEQRFVWFLLRAPDADLDLGTVRITGEARLVGKVEDTDRTPLVGACVYLQPAMPETEAPALLDAPPGFFARVTSTDRGGRFAFDGLQPGRYAIAIDAPGRGRQFAVARALAHRPLALTLTAGVALRGAVLDGAAPAAGALVEIALVAPSPAWRLAARRFGLEHYRVTTGDDGRFAIAGLPDGARCRLAIRRRADDREPAVIRDNVDPAAGELQFALPARQ